VCVSYDTKQTQNAISEKQILSRESRLDVPLLLIFQYNSIQFMFIYVQNLTAQWPIIKLARVYKDTEK
jgi:hypothetical protein